jgi:hypothetical protein
LQKNRRERKKGRTIMNATNAKPRLDVLLALGALWGMSEATMGMYLRGTCASAMSGSLMTGGALFFIAAGLSYSQRLYSALLLLLVASAFKLLDAYLLHLPFLHGAVANPIFAFLTEVAALVFLFKILDSRLLAKSYGRMLLGGLAALVAVNLFPLVGYVTRIPACVYAGTNYPLSLYYAPIAVGVSALTCPLGMAAGERLARVLREKPLFQSRPRLIAAASSAIAVISAIIMLALH